MYSHKGLFDEESENLRLIKKAMMLVVIHHADQTDKAGDPYVYHLFRVSLNVSESVQRDMVAQATAVGLLHDILEDTYVTKRELLQEIEDTVVVDAVETLTRKDNEEYFVYIKRVAESELARAVKLCDLNDHLARKENIDASLVKRYEKAKKILMEFL